MQGIDPVLLRMFCRDRRGGLALTVGLMMPVLFGAVGAAVEYLSLAARRTALQLAADSAALVAAKELTLANVSSSRIAAVAEQAARASLRSSSSRSEAEASIASEMVATNKGVKVVITEPVQSVLGRLIMLPLSELDVRATAMVSGRMKICLLGLDPQQKGTLHMEKNARLTAPGCAVYSSSKDQRGLLGEESSVMSAELICSAGGYGGTSLNFSPTPLTDCAPPSDPLASRQQPPIGACTSNDLVIETSGIIVPGTYCGGLKITKGAQVLARPGVYVMHNGMLTVDKKSALAGVNVGFYFTGDKGGLLFDEDTSVTLTAPKTGPMAGLLFFEDRSVTAPLAPPLSLLKGAVRALPLGTPPMRTYRITSNDARVLLGTIYLPAGRLIVDADKPVSDRSAYTVIVARRVDLYDGPNLVLNTNYQGSDIPVPTGLGPVGGKIMLAE